ncbi:ferrous iron transport protein A [Actinomadura sp. WAC 06369]|uniref:ferrous iron transport protein A n=1 Tax=Actinomadura sp. WAC 06369 TaxID=2203193 RepID=UPI000F784F0D|nr:ferrous iron transport protein A [Actinomadura sp. WAC 06369]RSN67552.1 ferrous iron transport protein A [Actinomadura sp. WAC 06369]
MSARPRDGGGGPGGPDPAAGALAAGRRVRVVRDPDWDGPWRNEFSGTIDSLGPPEPVRHPRALPGELQYWVVFDEPQYDGAGDGPYRKAQIWGRYLVPEG